MTMQWSQTGKLDPASMPAAGVTTGHNTRCALQYNMAVKTHPAIFGVILHYLRPESFTKGHMDRNTKTDKSKPYTYVDDLQIEGPLL